MRYRSPTNYTPFSWKNFAKSSSGLQRSKASLQHRAVWNLKFSDNPVAVVVPNHKEVDKGTLLENKAGKDDKRRFREII